MKNTCTSCGRKFDGEGVYCGNCLDEKGKLKSFEEVRNNLGEHIQKTQGYAEEPAGEIAESILKQQPAWEARFKNIQRKEDNERKRKVYTKLFISFLLGMVVCIVIIGLVYNSLATSMEPSYEPEVVLENISSPYVYFNNNYFFFRGLKNSEDYEVPVYHVDGENGEVKKINLPENIQISNRWTDAEVSKDYFVLNDHFGLYGEIYVWDYNSMERKIETNPGGKQNLVLLENWIAFNQGDQVFICDISDPDNKPYSIYTRTMDNISNYRLRLSNQNDTVHLLFIDASSELDTLYLYNTTTEKLSVIFEHNELRFSLFLDDNKILILTNVISEEQLLTGRKKRYKQQIIVYDIVTEETSLFKELVLWRQMGNTATVDGVSYFVTNENQKKKQVFIDENDTYEIEYEYPYGIIRGIDLKSMTISEYCKSERFLELSNNSIFDKSIILKRSDLSKYGVSRLLKYDTKNSELKTIVKVKNGDVQYFVEGDYLFYVVQKNRDPATLYRIKLGEG